MRLSLTAIVAGMCVAGPAAASSFVALPAARPGPSPSIVYLAMPVKPDAPQFAEPIHRISPSIVAYGTPAVEDVKVASIGDEPKPARFTEMPMVIRGGIVGDAFASAEPEVPAPDAEDPHRRMEGSVRAPARPPRPSPVQEQPQQAAAPPPSQARPGGLGAPR